MDSSKRTVSLADLATETNSFAATPRGLSESQKRFARRDASLSHPESTGASLLIFRDLAEADGWQVTESITAFAQPAGPTVQPAYEKLRGAPA